jgi:predicted metal-binding protein
MPVMPVIDYKVRGLCPMPYPGHKKGCPNFGKYPDCPPKAPFFDRYYDMSKPVYAIVNSFDLRAHTKKMRKAHPEWSDKQVECCLYWQGTARKELKAGIKEFNKLHPDYVVMIRPEAMGVNVTETVKGIGIKLEWPPKKKVYQVALAGIKVV